MPTRVGDTLIFEADCAPRRVMDLFTEVDEHGHPRPASLAWR